MVFIRVYLVSVGSTLSGYPRSILEMYKCLLGIANMQIYAYDFHATLGTSAECSKYLCSRPLPPTTTSASNLLFPNTRRGISLARLHPAMAVFCENYDFSVEVIDNLIA